ncbi:hypothetical protein ACLOJK_005274 [Asimina triloba]
MMKTNLHASPPGAPTCGWAPSPVLSSKKNRQNTISDQCVSQVARVLQLIYRLVVQPNTSRAHTFAEAFISCGGIETLLLLLQREAKAGDNSIIGSCTNHAEYTSASGSRKCPENLPVEGSGLHIGETQEKSLDGQFGSENVPVEGSGLETSGLQDRNPDYHSGSEEGKESISQEGCQLQVSDSVDSSIMVSLGNNIGRSASSSESQIIKNLGGINFSISAHSARNNVYNVDNGDGIIVRIISLLGALVASGHLKLRSSAAFPLPSSNLLGNGLPDEGNTMFSDKISLLLFALQKAFQAAPQRLMTANVYMALLGAAINASSTDEGMHLYDSGHRFEHVQLLLVLLRSLPYASKAFQARAIQVACPPLPHSVTLSRVISRIPSFVFDLDT